MSEEQGKLPYQGKRLAKETTAIVLDDPNYRPKRLKIEDEVESYPRKSGKGKRLQKKHGINLNFKPKKAKRLAMKIKKPNILSRISAKIKNNKVANFIFKILICVPFALIMTFICGSTPRANAKDTGNLNVGDNSNDSLVNIAPLDFRELNRNMLNGTILGTNLVLTDKTPDEEFDFSALTAEEKVDYFMDKYDLTLEDLQLLLNGINERMDEEHREEIDAYYSAVMKVPQVKYLSTDFVSYGGPVSDLLPLYNVTEAQYEVIAKTLIQAGGKLNYKEAFALMTLVLNRLICTEYPDNIYDIIVQPGQFDAYLSGDYEEIKTSDYPEAMQAFTECLWNFNQTPEVRYHSCLDWVEADKSVAGYDTLFNLGGNNYGKLLNENNIKYPDIEPVATLG